MGARDRLDLVGREEHRREGVARVEDALVAAVGDAEEEEESEGEREQPGTQADDPRTPALRAHGLHGDSYSGGGRVGAVVVTVAENVWGTSKASGRLTVADVWKTHARITRHGGLIPASW